MLVVKCVVRYQEFYFFNFSVTVAVPSVNCRKHGTEFRAELLSQFKLYRPTVSCVNVLFV